MMMAVGMLRLRLQRVLLRRFAGRIARRGDFLEVFEECDVLGIDLDGSSQEVVVVVEERGDRGEAKADRLEVALGRLGQPALG